MIKKISYTVQTLMSGASERVDFHTKELLSKALAAFFVKIMSATLSFAFSVAVARSLGADSSGVFFLALTTVIVASAIGRAGLDNTLLRFVAANAAAGRWHAVKGASGKGVLLGLAASASVSVLLFFSAPLIAEKVFSKAELVSVLRWMSLAIVPMSMLTLHAEMLKGIKKVSHALFVQGMGTWAFALAAFPFIYTLGTNGAAAAYVFGAAVTAAIGIYAWRRMTPAMRAVAASFETRELFRSCFPLFITAVLALLIDLVAMVMLGAWRSTSDVAFFSTASRTAQLINLILVAVNSIAAPKFAELYAAGDIASLGRFARNTALTLTVLASPVLLVFVMFPGAVMGIFGSEFIAGSLALVLLSAGQFINVSTGSVGYLLMMSGNEVLMRNNLIATALLNICLNAALIPAYGFIGAAAATAASLSFQNLYALYLVKKHLGINAVPWIGGERPGR